MYLQNTNSRMPHVQLFCTQRYINKFSLSVMGLSKNLFCRRKNSNSDAFDGVVARAQTSALLYVVYMDCLL